MEAGIPRLRELAKKPLARRGRKDSSRRHDSRRLSDLGGTAGPDRAGSGRDGRTSSGPAGERAGGGGPRGEVRGGWPGAADRRRYDPDTWRNGTGGALRMTPEQFGHLYDLFRTSLVGTNFNIKE